MIRHFMQFWREWTRADFDEMISFVVPGCGDDYKAEKVNQFAFNPILFLADLTPMSIERLENWLMCRYADKKETVNINALLNSEMQL